MQGRSDFSFPDDLAPLPQYDPGQFYTLLEGRAGFTIIRIHNENGSIAAVIDGLTERQAELYVRRLEEAGVWRARAHVGTMRKGKSSNH